MTWKNEIEEVLLKRKLALEQGGLENIRRQHAKGLLTIRERISVMLDDGSFREIGPTSGGVERKEDGSLKSFSPANFILGFGKIKGKRCIIGGEDFTVRGGSPNEAGLRKSIYTEDLALQHLIPLIRKLRFKLPATNKSRLESKISFHLSQSVQNCVQNKTS